MNVLFITRKYPPAIGGMETFSYGLTRALGKACTVWNLKKPWSIRWKRYDVIHLGDGVLAGLGVILKFLFHVPVAITIHGLDVTYPKRWYQRYIRWALPIVDAVVCVSPATQQAVTDRLKPKQCVVISNGVDVDDWNVGTDTRRHLLFVGRLVPRKGCRWFVDNVMPKLPDHIQLHIIGTGEEYSSIQPSRRVHLHGTISPSDVQKFYQQSAVLIMPNIVVPGDMEGFGMVALEAGACGLPVVAARLEGIAGAVIDGQTGFLVESGNVSAWIAAIQRVLASPLDPFVIRSAVAQHYDWKHIKEHYQTLWQHLHSPIN